MKKFVSIILSIFLIFAMIPKINVNAASTRQTPVNHGWARIRYAGNNRYIDVPAEALDNNGTQLQLWDYAYGNQNQIFYFQNTGEGWKIFSHITGKVIEVRDSSHKDYAQVAQWDEHNLACARWDIIANDDGTVSFRNRESGLYLNVCGGGDAQNGTKLIQYHDDGTIAMKFYLDVMTHNDVLSATFARSTKISEVKWTEYNPFKNYTTINNSGWQYKSNGKYYYPTPNQSPILDSAEYLSPNTVANLLRDKAYDESTWNQIKSALNGEWNETKISALLDSLGFEDVPGLGYALGILQVLWDSQDSQKWNKFVDAAKIDAQGRCSGVIVYTYYKINKNYSWGPLNNGTTAWGTITYIVKTPYVEYKTWTGDNFYDIQELPVSVKSGKWWYYFK